MMRTILVVLLLAAPMAAAPTPGAVLESGETKTRFAKLSLALEAAKPGDTVRLEPGDHRGSFGLPAGVKLVGDGKARLIQRGARPGLLSTGEGGSVEGVEFHAPVASAKVFSELLHVKRGRLEVRECRFTGTPWRGALVGKAVAIFDRCTFEARGRYAIRIHDSVGTEIWRCRIVGASMTGIDIRSSKILITRTEIRANGRVGIYLSQDRGTRIEQCRIAGNGMTGVSVYDDSSPVIAKNRFEGNLSQALSFERSSSPTIRCNVITGNPIGISKFERTTSMSFIQDVYRLGRPDIEDNVLLGNHRDYAHFLSHPQHRRVIDPARDADVGIGDESNLPPAVADPPRPKEVGILSGRVLDADGAPLPDAWVVLGLSDRQRVACSDPAGRFRLSEVPAGRWQPGAGAVGSIYRLWPDRYEVRAGEETKLPDLVLARDRPIRGRVEDGRGDPTPGAIVYAIDFEIAQPIGIYRGIAELNGNFRIGGFPPDRRTLLTFRRLWREPGLIVAHIHHAVDAGRSGLHFVRGVERVGVRVTDADGEPAPDFDLAVCGEPDAGGEILVTKWMRIWSARDFEWPVEFGDRADPVRLQLPPGTYQFIARRRQNGKVRWIAHQTSIRIEKERSRSVDLVFERPGRITGRVLDEDGKGIPHAVIRSAEAPGAPKLFEFTYRDPEVLYRVTADESGKFRIDPVVPGERRFLVTADGYRSKEVTVAGVKGRKTSKIEVVLTR